MKDQEFPKFIQNKPTGKDFLEGKSAERVAKAIESHIEKINELNLQDPKLKLPQIIGLEGGWGSGKSNVVRILKTNVENNYYLYEYDAWGNQEDLQRRSFLEQLTQKLIDKKILDGETEVTKRGGGKETVTWEEKLKYLLARKTETITEKYPRISNSMAASAIVAILTPVFVFIAYVTKQPNNPWWSVLLSIFISMIPVLVSLIVWRFACKKDSRYKNFEYLLAIHNKKIENDVNYETISEDEPSVSEFKSWMNDISDFIEINKKKKLIVVFDNMDRLPSDKVKELWSSIHTFFSEDGYKNLWVIIPFDKIHLANAFSDGKIENNNQTKELTCQFIVKTFPIIYRVAAPILTDRKEIFNKFYADAFGTTEDDSKEKIQRIFSLIRSNYTPRDIIAFINELVSLKLSWTEEIPLIPIAIFVLKKEEILESSIDEYILSKKYLTSIEKIIEDTEQLQNDIAALTYGIDIGFAAQIPLKQYLRNTLKGDANLDINKYSNNKHFVSILKEEVKNIDSALLDKAIISLSLLKKSTEISITEAWNDLNKFQLQQKIDKLAFIDTHKLLLLNVDDENRKKLAKYLCNKYRECKEFKGDLFYLTMQSFEKYILENKLNFSISEYLLSKQVTPEIFIEYVTIAKNDFIKYKILCDNKTFDEYLARATPSHLPRMDFIEFLIKDDLYKFEVFKESIENAITDNLIDAVSFPELIKAYKLISKEKPLNQQFTPSQIQSLYNATIDKTSQAYFDLVAMELSNKLINTPCSEGLDEKVAKRIEYYQSYSNLLIISKDWNSELLRKSVKIMTEKSYGTNMSLLNIMPFFEEIKTAINISADVFLKEISRWVNSIEKITKENIESLIPKYSFYEYSCKINNKLTAHINNTAITRIKEIPIEDLYAQRNTPAYYWLNCVSILIKEGIVKSLPENLTEYCKKILSDIAASKQTIFVSGSVNDIIIKKADKRNLQPTIKNICMDFCNKTIIITPILFLYFDNEFDFLNKVTSREGDISSIILNTIIEDTNCLNHILDNNSNYIKIIKKAGDDANDLKTKIRQLLQTNKTDKLESFASAIGIKKEIEKNDNE